MRTVWRPWLVQVALPPLIFRDVWWGCVGAGKVYPEHGCEKMSVGDRGLRRSGHWHVRPRRRRGKIEGVWQEILIVRTKGVFRRAFGALNWFRIEEGAVGVNFGATHKAPSAIGARPNHLFRRVRR
jgi:hypothetical protein